MLQYIPTTLQATTPKFTDKVGDIVDVVDLINLPDTLDLGSGCSRQFDVKNYLPNWLVLEDKAGEPSFVKFIQYYYDWFYCPAESGIYANEIFDYIDINNITDDIKGSVLNSYLPGVYPIFQTYGYDPKIENIIKVLTNIKLDLYQRKTSPSCVNQFFSDMFDDVVSVSVTTTAPGTLSIEFNLIESSEINLSMLDDIYREVLHPYGMIFNSSLTTINFTEDLFRQASGTGSSGGNTFGTAVQSFEIPKLGNYMVYNMGDTGTIEPITGCYPEGVIRVRGISANTADMPTFNHPSWNDEIPNGVSFGNINILDFLIMEYTKSPNSGITSCP